MYFLERDKLPYPNAYNGELQTCTFLFMHLGFWGYFYLLPQTAKLLFTGGFPHKPEMCLHVMTN